MIKGCKGIAGIASNIQTRDAAEGLAGAQKDYYEAQTGKLEAETKALPGTRLITAIQQYAKILETLLKNNDGSESTALKIQETQGILDTLNEQYAKSQGFASVDAATSRDQRLKASGISVT